MACLIATPCSAKPKPAKTKPPDLRIVTVIFSPEPFSLTSGALELAVEVELPADVNGATILEVSSFISSPSRRFMRFLSDRQPLEFPVEAEQAEAPGGKPRVLVKLIWDGTDQARQPVMSGLYRYEVRAKLLAVGESGPRTQMVSWPKRGTLEVK